MKYGLRLLCLGTLSLMLAGGALSQPHEDNAPKPPGFKGHLKFTPSDWTRKNSWWADTDGVDPGTAGCHVGVTEAGVPNKRFFGEACTAEGLLVESTPAAEKVHLHENDVGFPYLISCQAWCSAVRKTAGGVCKPVAGPAPCNSPTGSARCECK